MSLATSPPTSRPGTACDSATCLHLTVVGVHRAGRQYVYRLAGADGTYVGRTRPTDMRAAKGDRLHVAPDELEKDSPPDAGEGSTGPTSDTVHVDAPLRAISVAYGTGKSRKERQLKVLKAAQVGQGAKMQQLVYGIVLEPNTVDSQGDWVPEEHVELTAHRYLARSLTGKTSVHRIGHSVLGFNKTNPKLVPVESFIAPVDFSYGGNAEVVQKGSWVLVAKVLDPKLWKDIQDGKYTGWSVGGTGQRHDLTRPAVSKTAEESTSTEPTGYRFAVDPAGGVEIWAVSDDVPDRAGQGVHLDGGIYGLPADDPAMPIVKAWVRQVLSKDAYRADELPEPEPTPEPPAVESFDDSIRSEDQRLLRQLVKSVAAIADRPAPAIHVTTPDVVVPPAQVTVENVLPAPKPRKVTAVTREDGSREYEVVE